MIYTLIRTWSLPYKLYLDGQAPVRPPEGFRVFGESEPPPEEIREAVAEAYAKAFSGPPWYESWKEQEVLDKMEGDLRPPFRLVVMEGDEEHPVGGFCWGALVRKEEVLPRIVNSAGIEGQEAETLGAVLGKEIRGEGVFFLDEIAILPPFRGGVTPIQFLIRPLMEASVAMGYREGVSWTHRDSTIAYISRYAGFRPLRPSFGEKVVIYCRDCLPILKILQNVDGDRIAALIGKVSGLLGVRKR
ncbi:MAG: hypothetical protein WHT46_06490 [Candidatus Geothermincolales bacterium]